MGGQVTFQASELCRPVFLEHVDPLLDLTEAGLAQHAISFSAFLFNIDKSRIL